jgi:glycosyltransferase involved in cell wall biosynthesis
VAFRGRDGETGVLRDVGDVDAMADGARQLLTDDARWLQASQLGERDARDRFSLDAIVSQYEALYVEALEARVR